MAERHKELYSNLIDTGLGCVSPGFVDTAEVYEAVKDTYPGLCDDSVRCRDVCDVIALCPNCHRRRHYGRNGDEF